ncbi:MAG TPA: DUF3137 domain-containing protein, partial [Bacteroidia bacterium]|nr:DUF3137 domain-containing protein [Bacteroidia bacterium]
YTKVLSPKVAALEEERLRTRMRYLVFVIAFASLLAGTFLYTLIWWGPGFLPSAIICGIGISYATFQLLAYLITNPYKVEFKESIVSEIIRFYDPKLEYDAEQGIQEKAVEISSLFNASIGEFNSNDYVEGKLDDVFVQFSEIELYQNIHGLNKKFKGLFMIAQFNKHFDGNYIVLPDPDKHTLRTAIGQTMGLGASFWSDPIKMESPEFEAIFTVYGTDEIEARYIITPAMMSRMLDFRQKVNGDVYFSFIMGRLFVAISSKTSLFAPSLFRPVDYETVLSWNRSLQLALSIVQELKLNTRIWSKK